MSEKLVTTNDINYTKKTKERPILFSREMVRAILDGRKTQSRRVIKPQPEWKYPGNYERQGVASHIYGLWWITVGFGVACENQRVGYCPYGKPGGRLWVRETWAHDDPNCKNIHCGNIDHIWYRASENGFIADSFSGDAHWHPSIFMPRWARRILLEIVDIRIQKIQDISEEDAKKEGIPWDNEGFYFLEDNKNTFFNKSAKSIYSLLWDWINARPKAVYRGKVIDHYESYPWNDIHKTQEYRGKPWIISGNPWVWVIEFEKKESEHG